MPKIELRSADTEWRSTRAYGYAALFDVWTTVGNYFAERIKPGAFRKTLVENPDVLCLWNHNADLLLGRTSSGSLHLAEDSKGLFFELEIDPRSSAGSLALSALDRGDVRGMSFGFTVPRQSWSEDDIDLPQRTIEEIALHEVTVCPNPQYRATSASLRRSAPQHPGANPENAMRRISARRALMEQKIRGIR